MAFIHKEEHLEEQTRPRSDRICAHGRENQLGHGLSGSQL